MDFVFQPELEEDWPDDVEKKYQRFEVLGKGSFGMVWMSRRLKPPENEYDDEYVAIKSIHIKNEKGNVYAEREIRILQELRHPNVIRLIKAFPVYAKSRVVVMQLARGPNLHQLVVKRGALGLPLSRLVSRHLVAAVSYIHGRAVLHRDIKPSNCILALANERGDVDYDWYGDRAIWSSKEDGVEAVKSNKWKLMLVDFGFARALEKDEIVSQTKHLRNSIVYETSTAPPLPAVDTAKQEEATSTKKEAAATTDNKSYVPRSMYPTTIPEDQTGDDAASIEADMEALESMVLEAAKYMRKSQFEATNSNEAEIMGSREELRKRQSGVSMMPIAETSSKEKKNMKDKRRMSTARQHIRSMSALGTKAYAAPEIRKKLRHKNEADFEKANAAMTECVADYGMIVDAYSVGWTLRVAMTGVPPNFSISEYMKERDTVVLEDGEEGEESIEKAEYCCYCFAPIDVPIVRIRDPTRLPSAATLLITRMTEKQPQNRMTVREAQNDPWIAGQADEDDPPYDLPQGDIPSKHGDPVVPLDCAAELSKLTVKYHMQ